MRHLFKLLNKIELTHIGGTNNCLCYSSMGEILDKSKHYVLTQNICQYKSCVVHNPKCTYYSWNNVSLFCNSFLPVKPSKLRETFTYNERSNKSESETSETES